MGIIWEHVCIFILLVAHDFQFPAQVTTMTAVDIHKAALLSQHLIGDVGVLRAAYQCE